MKNLTKIFMAVVALFAVSCVTDPIEDLGVNLGEGQTTISISLEESRTHLGTEVNREYPLYWSEGDKIAVNGKASNALPKSAHGQQSATFTLNGAVGFPRTIVYPAPAEGVTAATAGNYPVTFSATQAYKAGSFAEGAAPMYAYQSSSEATVELQHLSGVLRLAPYGEGVTLKAVVVTAENGKLAGNFDVDSEGKLTAHADAVNSVTVTFGDGLALGTDATPIYVAVPAGEFGVVTVTLYTDKGSMSKSFNTEGNAINAGKVREFPAFEFTASGEAGDDFLIYDEASLREFAANVANIGEGKTYTGAKLVANVDITGKEWTSITNENEFLLDGCDHEIKGLTASLFEDTACSIKNLKLVNVNINETSRSTVGALACNITSANSVVENCSATGDAVVNLASPNAEALIAGLIGSTTSTKTFSNLINKVDVEVGGACGQAAYIAGCVARIGNGAISQSANLGSICTKVTFSGNYTLYIAGVAGLALTLSNCYNGSEDAVNDKTKGAITIDGSCSTVRFGGIVSSGPQGMTYSNCKNYGKLLLTNNSSLSASLFMGGIVGISQASTIPAKYTSCENQGDIIIQASSIAKNCRVGGFMGSFQGSRDYYKITGGFNNSGNILVENVAGDGTMQIGGFVGYHDDTANSSSTGVVKNSGTITYKANSATKVRIGGIIGDLNTGFEDNSVTYENTGSIFVTGKDSSKEEFYVGGIAAASSTVYNSRSYATITTTNCQYVGAIVGNEYVAGQVNKSHCGGVIVKDGSTNVLDQDNYTEYIHGGGVDPESEEEKALVNEGENGWLNDTDKIAATAVYKFIAGVKLNSFNEFLAWATAQTTATSTDNVELTTDITLPEGTVWTPIEGFNGVLEGKNHSISGLTAPLFGATSASIQNLNLTDVDIDITEWGTNYIGALATEINGTGAEVKNCSVSGTLDIDVEKATLYVGGVIGNSVSTETFSDLTNSLNITVKGKYSSEMYCAGCVYDHEGALSNVRNLGAVKYSGTSCSALRLAGITCGCADLVNCYNGSADNVKAGEIAIDGSCAGTRTGGLVGNASNGLTMTNCINYGKVYMSQNATTTGSVWLGGLVGMCQNADIEVDGCENHGELAMEQSTSTAAVEIGGLLGRSHPNNSYRVTINNSFTNTGAINANPASATDVYIGGIYGRHGIPLKTTDENGVIRNTGAITYSGTATGTVRVAGMMACTQRALLSSLHYENTGNITVTGTGATAVWVGGFSASQDSNPITVCNFRSFCKVKAVGYAEDAVGMVVAGAYNEQYTATNCHIGGSINLTGQEPDKINAEEFYYIHIYGSSIDPAIADENKCGYLEEDINSAPRDSYGKLIVF